MENSNKKILTMSYLIAGALSAFVIGKLLDAFSGIIPALAKLTAIDFVQHGVPVLVGFGIFVYLQVNKRVNAYFDEVVTELKKIVWPSQKDVVAMTIVVSVMVVVAGFMLGLFDAVSGYVVAQLVKIPLP